MILLLWRSNLRSAWGVASCFAVISVLSQVYQIEQGTVLGLVSLASLVLIRSTLVRRRRTRRAVAGVAFPHFAVEPEPDLGPPAPESP